MRVAPDRPLLMAAALLWLPGCAWLVWKGGWVAPALMLAVIAAALADLLRSRARLRSVEVIVEPILRTTVGNSCPVELRCRNLGAKIPLLRVGLPLPDEMRPAESAVVEWSSPLETGAGVRLVVNLVPLRRGRYSIPCCHAETRSAWRLWLVRRVLKTDVEVRVYPDLRQERRRLSALLLHRGADGSQVLRQTGKGREFEKLREYQAGDDFGDIDWKATSRRGMPITRTYQIERTQEVYVVIDRSRLSAREYRWSAPRSRGKVRADGTAEALTNSFDSDSRFVETQLDRFLKSALVLSSVAQMQGDHVGLVSFANRVDRFVRAGSGSEHYSLIRDQVYNLRSEAVAPDFEELTVTLRQRLSRRALVVMLVDLGDPLTAESFFDAVPLIARRHVVIVNMVRPPQAQAIFSGKRNSAGRR